MGWWFGRKNAPADVGPFVPAWLSADSAEEGFARSREGMIAILRTSGLPVTYRSDAWDIGTNVCSKIVVAGKQVVGAQAAAVGEPTGGTTVDEQCREAVTLVLSALRQHGLIAV